MVAAGVEAIGNHDRRISEVSTPVSSWDHGEQSGRLVSSQSKWLLIGGPSTQSLSLTPLARAVDKAGASSKSMLSVDYPLTEEAKRLYMVCPEGMVIFSCIGAIQVDKYRKIVSVQRNTGRRAWRDNMH